MTEPVFLGALGIFAITAVLVARAIAGAISGRGASRSEMARFREQLDQHAAALQDVEVSLANQAPQLAELQERLDFTERLLVQARDQTQLGSGKKRE
jgi:hypothetical protein